MNREGEAFRCHNYASLLANHGVEATVFVAEVRGEMFMLHRETGQATED